MVDNKITKKRIREHWAYSRWKYILLACVCVAAWSLIYSMTEYHPPKERRIHVYTMTAGADATALQEAYAQPVLDTLEETEEVQFFVIGLSASNSDYSTEMQFSTYIGAQEGDVFMCPTYKFYGLSRGEDGLFVPLEDYIAQGLIDVGDIDLEPGTDIGADGKEHVFGIPMDSLFGLLDYNVDPAQLFLCIPVYSQNQDNAVRAINTLLRLTQAPKPDWYDRYKENQISGSRPDSLIFD